MSESSEWTPLEEQVALEARARVAAGRRKESRLLFGNLEWVNTYKCGEQS